MANIIEKRLPKHLRDKMSTMIGVALGFFLASQYNNVITEIINRIFPIGDQTAARILYIIVLTFVVVYLTIFVEKLLDGR